MKKLLLLALSFMLVNFASAQLKIIPSLGINGTRYTSDPGNNIAFANSRIGYHFGANARLGGRWYLEPGIFWYRSSTELQNVDPGDINFGLIEQTQVNSIKVPVAVGFSVLNSDIFRLRLSAGAALGWITSVKDNSFYTKEDYSKNQWAARFGVGVDLWFITVDVNYELGLNSTFSDGSDTKSNILSLTAGLRL